MANETKDYSLLQGVVTLFRISWSGVTAIIAGILLLFLILTAYLQGYFTDGLDWSFWRFGLQPSIIVYIFVVSPLIQRFWERAIESLRIILPQPDLVNGIASYNRRWEWTALFSGAVFATLMSRPWVFIEDWITLYTFITELIMFSLLGLLIYGGLATSVRLAQLSRHHLLLDIFDSELLVPVSRWSLSLSLAFVGGICLSVLFQPIENLKNVYGIIVYSILISVTILLFFTSMWSIHNALASAKKREMEMVRKNLSNARRELKQHSAKGIMVEMDKYYSAITAWGIYEKQVLEASTWPLNAGITKRLLVSTVTPIAIYLIKIFLPPWLRF